MPSETLANGTDQIIHKLDLNEYGLNDVPEELKKEAKKEVADYLKNEILRDINASTSPVQGEGRFKALEPEYAVRDKGGNRLSNLELEGDLLDSFRVDVASGSYLDIGHLGEEVPKADGHNQLSGKAKSWARSINFPRRRYIPDDGQKYVPKITGEIKSIISTYASEFTTRIVGGDIVSPTTESVVETEEGAEVGVDFLSDDLIGDLLADALRRRRGV